MRVLIVEDEKATAALIQKAFAAEGLVAEALHNGLDALKAIETSHFDVIILDVMLPGQDGLSLLRQLRQHRNNTPVLMLTARGDVGDRVEGLNAGADDYLPKPFALSELVARVRALSRRRAEGSVLAVGDLSLDTATRRAARDGKAIELTTREYRLLEYLMRSAGQVCPRMAIVENVWEYDFDPGTNLVEVYVMRLREKIEEGFASRLLHTVRGVGYVLKEAE